MNSFLSYFAGNGVLNGPNLGLVLLEQFVNCFDQSLLLDCLLRRFDFGIAELYCKANQNRQREFHDWGQFC